jgi:hypothetical protein
MAGFENRSTLFFFQPVRLSVLSTEERIGLEKTKQSDQKVSFGYSSP